MDDAGANLNLHNKEKTYYTILGCSEDASLDQLKQSYQTLIKKYHPDKQGTSQSNDEFILIDRAYKTLRDKQLRKEYNASLLENRFNEHFLIYAEISKCDLNFEDGVAYYPCRCGDKIVIGEDVLKEEQCVIECGECTNCIKVK